MFGIFDRFTNSYGASATVADGRLVLSLPDAETPALWMMDLNDAATSVLRLENDRQGLYVIKKHGGQVNGKPAAAETIAVYRDRHAALDALNKASRALEKARNMRTNTLNGRPVIVRPASRLGRVLTYLLFFWFVMYLMGLDQFILPAIFDVFSSPDVPSAGASALQVPDNFLDSAPAGEAPAASATPPAKNSPSGVPMTADDFLRSQAE